jgi:Lysozyme like domain
VAPPRNQQSPAAIAQAAKDAGFTGTQIAIATAIALAESGGDASAHNTKGEDSRGLWQINVAPTANPDLIGMALFDPRTNARAAKIVYDRQGWAAWSVFKSGKYRTHMGEAQMASGQTGPANPAGVGTGGPLEFGGSIIQGQLGGLEGIADALQKGVAILGRIGQWLTTPANLGRLAIGVGGVVIVVAGVVVLMKPAAEQALKIASAVK